MSEPKFTKGPWYSYSHDFKDCLDEYYTEWGVSSSYTKRGICTMLGADSEDEINANAALIAAAPEMYVMLEQLVEAVKTLNAISLIKIKDKLIEDAVNIIKKARGEE